MITLCPTTYELAKQNPNFSLWVRQELMKKMALQHKAKPEIDTIYGAYCLACDLTYSNTADFLVQGFDCKKCGARTTFLGEIQ